MGAVYGGGASREGREAQAKAEFSKMEMEVRSNNLADGIQLQQYGRFWPSYLARAGTE